MATIEPAPHGGKLVDRFISTEKLSQCLSELCDIPALTLDARELADLELIATGAASPLEGFLASADYDLFWNGCAWPTARSGLFH